MGLQSGLAALGGDLWVSARCVALWPWPATVIGAVHSKTGWDDQRLFEAILRPGDFILTRTNRYKASNRAIPGAYKHLAVYVGPVRGRLDRERHAIDKPKTLGLGHIPAAHPVADTHLHAVVHAISEGVVCQDLGELLLHADYAAAVRPWTTREQQVRILECALGSVGLGYNFDFKPSGPEALYCTELGVTCAREAGISNLPAAERVAVSLAGVLLPLDALRYPVTLADNFLCYPMVCCTVSSSEPRFQRYSRLSKILRKAISEAPDAVDP